MTELALPAARGTRNPDTLPQILALSAEGLSSHAVGARLGVTKSTVCYWRRRMRPKPARKEPPGPAAALRRKIEYYESVSDELYQEWFHSKADKQVQVVEQSGPAGDETAGKRKTTIRTETRTANPALLAKSMAARKMADAFQEQLAALERSAPAGPVSPPGPLANLTDHDLEKLSPDDLENFSDEQLLALQARLRAACEGRGLRCKRPLPAAEEPPKRHDAEPSAVDRSAEGGDLCGAAGDVAALTAMESRPPAEIEVPQREVQAPETKPVPAGDIDSQGSPARPEPPCEPTGAKNAGAADPTGKAVAAVEKSGPKPADPPRLTWDQQHAAALAAIAARERRWKRYTNPARGADSMRAK